MLYKLCIVLLLHAKMGYFSQAQASCNQNERLKKMNHKTKSWLEMFTQEAKLTSGKTITKDTQSQNVVITSELIVGKSPRISEIIKQVCPLLVQAYLDMELEFAQTHPELVPSEMFLKTLAPLFSKGTDSVDWQEARKQLSSFLERFFTTTNFSEYAQDDDVQLFVQAHDQSTQKILGIQQFIVTAKDADFSVKAGLAGTTPVGASRGIDAILMQSIYTIASKTQKVYLHTRSTHTKMLEKYISWGFTKTATTQEHWVNLANVSQ